MKGRQEIWYKRVEDRIKSGLTIKQWCEKNDISFSIFRNWNSKYNNSIENEEDNFDTPKWIEVTENNVSLNNKSSSSFRISIGKAAIEVPADFNLTASENIVSVLSKQC